MCSTWLGWMNLLQEYEFDCLPYLDKEYDDPAMKQQVAELIIQEMKSFTPNRTYIEHLPYPKLTFSRSQTLQNEMARVAKKTPMEKIDISKYEAEKPEGPLEKDIQAWRRAVNNAKIQLEYQDNRLMNLELADSYGGPVWLHANSASEGTIRQLDAQTAQLRHKCDEIHQKRRLEQENAASSLYRMTFKANETVMKTWQIKHACDDLENQLKRIKSSHHHS